MTFRYKDIEVYIYIYGERERYIDIWIDLSNKTLASFILSCFTLKYSDITTKIFGLRDIRFCFQLCIVCTKPCFHLSICVSDS